MSSDVTGSDVWKHLSPQNIGPRGYTFKLGFPKSPGNFQAVVCFA